MVVSVVFTYYQWLRLPCNRDLQKTDRIHGDRLDLESRNHGVLHKPTNILRQMPPAGA